MLKHLKVFTMVVGLLAALAIPASASAFELTEEGEAIVPPATITGTNIGDVTTGPLPGGIGGGKLVCGVVTLPGTLTENGPETVAGEGKGGTTEECVQHEDNGDEREFTVDGIEYSLDAKSSEAHSGTYTAAFVVHLGGVVVCHFASPEPGIFHYVTGVDELELTPVRVTAAEELCENEEEPILFNGRFTLTGPNGGPAWMVE